MYWFLFCCSLFLSFYYELRENLLYWYVIRKTIMISCVRYIIMKYHGCSDEGLMRRYMAFCAMNCTLHECCSDKSCVRESSRSHWRWMLWQRRGISRLWSASSREYREGNTCFAWNSAADTNYSGCLLLMEVIFKIF